MRVALSALKVAEYFREQLQQGMLPVWGRWK